MRLTRAIADLQPTAVGDHPLGRPVPMWGPFDARLDAQHDVGVWLEESLKDRAKAEKVKITKLR